MQNHGPTQESEKRTATSFHSNITLEVNRESAGGRWSVGGSPPSRGLRRGVGRGPGAQETIP